MAINLLSELNSGSRRWTVQVFVSRLWHHRGGTDAGPIRHTDMVLLDAEGGHIYAEVPADCVDQFIHVLLERKIYVLQKFVVYQRKHMFRPVEARYMIKFGRYTTALEKDSGDLKFPFCTYVLTPLASLPKPTDMPERFTDIIGMITAVSEPTQFHSASRAEPSIKRMIYLKDLTGHQITVVLWGERAMAFDGNWVLQAGKESPVIVIFVGTLVKSYEGRRGVNGSAACRWYINEDLPAIHQFHIGLKDKFSQVERIILPNQTSAEISAQVDLETKTVAELLDLDIFVHEEARFFCTVTLTKLSPSQRWWFSSCTLCHKSSLPYGAAYRCSDPSCPGTDALPRYRLCYIGAAEESEAEFVFFDRMGRELIGKPLITILRSGHPQRATLSEIMNSARTDAAVPRELAAVVAKKFRFVVSISTKSFDPESKQTSFQVHRHLGNQSHSSAFYHGPVSGSTLPAQTAPGVMAPLSSSSTISVLPEKEKASTSLDLSSGTGGQQTGSSKALVTMPKLLTPPSVNQKNKSRGKDEDPTSNKRRKLFIGDGSDVNLNQDGLPLSPAANVMPVLPAKNGDKSFELESDSKDNLA